MSIADRDPEEAPNERPPKWQTEVDDILKKNSLEPGTVDRARGRVTSMRYRAPNRTQRVRQRLDKFSPVAVLMVIVVTLALGSFIVGHFIPLLGKLMAFGALIAVGAIIVLMFVGRGSSSGPTRTWRGRDITLEDDDRPRWR